MWQKAINHCTKCDYQDPDSLPCNRKLDGGPCEGEVENKITEHEDLPCRDCAHLKGQMAQMAEGELQGAMVRQAKTDAASSNVTREIASTIPQAVALGLSDKEWRKPFQQNEVSQEDEDSSHDTGETSLSPPSSYPNDDNNLYSSSPSKGDPAVARAGEVAPQASDTDIPTDEPPPFLSKGKGVAEVQTPQQQHSHPGEYVFDSRAHTEYQHPETHNNEESDKPNNKDSPYNSTRKDNDSHTLAPPCLLTRSLPSHSIFPEDHPQKSSALSPSPNWSPASLLTSPTPAPPNSPATAPVAGGIGIDQDERLRLGIPLTQEGLERSMWRKYAKESFMLTAFGSKLEVMEQKKAEEQNCVE